MRTTLTVLLAAAALATGGLAPSSAAPAMPLNGAQEPSAADNDGHGFFSYTLDGTEFCYTLAWTGIETPFAAHVHVAPRHVAGPIVIPLSIGDGSGAPVEACTVIAPDLAAAITANPKAYYVNVHNATFPAGAIRGQLK
jgi:CHRD domain